MARIARHTQSWTRTGLGPGANFLSSNKSWLRSAGRSAAETWVPRSYVIWSSQHPSLLLAGALACLYVMYLALQGRGGEQLRLCLGRVLEDGYRRGPSIVLRVRSVADSPI
jgi:hypothetical protein